MKRSGSFGLQRERQAIEEIINRDLKWALAAKGIQFETFVDYVSKKRGKVDLATEESASQNNRDETEPETKECS